jgi:hypothetical protein
MGNLSNSDFIKVGQSVRGGKLYGTGGNSS